MAGKAHQPTNDSEEVQGTAADLAQKELQRIRDAANTKEGLLNQLQITAKKLDPILLDKLLKIAQILAR